MARPLRVEYEGAIYHVTVRGNARQNIFRDDGDRRLLYSCFEECVPRYAVRVYLFCLMQNHLHLVVETPKANLGRFMQSVLTAYAVSYNLRHRCHGHLTQGRYGARLVSGDRYLLKLSRYVHLNPVKVKNMQSSPLPDRIAYLRQYPWSSYRGYTGQARRLEWVEYEPVLRLLGGRGEDKAELYKEFVEAGVAEDDEEFIKALSLSPRSIGDEEFRAEVEGLHGQMLKKRRRPQDVAFRHVNTGKMAPDKVMRAVASVSGLTEEGLLRRHRGWEWKGIAARLLVMECGLTQRDCAQKLGLRSGSAVSYQMRKAGDALAVNKQLARAMARIMALCSR